jgi:hypothetical protein
MKRALLLVLLVLTSTIARAAEPDYSAWTRILRTYYDPAKGMSYGALKAKDAAALETLKQQLGKVNVAALTPKQQLAYWINVYNVNSVATIVESYPVESIRDLSTDPIIRLNVFKKERAPFGGALLSLDEIENKRIREGFHDPRIHFAINCAARSCPPIRTEAYTGANVDAQLDDQVRRFLDGPLGVHFGRKGDTLVVHVTKIMDWFKDDFETWGGGRVAFLKKYLAPAKAKLFDGAKDVDFEFDDYDWKLNDNPRS